MEKYSTFAGLTSLQASNLYNNKAALPEVGFIGDFVKSGDHLTCDISSLDIWLDVKIEAEEIGLVVFFEIKVYKEKKISAFKKSLLDIANQIFKSRSLTVLYEETEAEIHKINLVYVENNLTTESKSVLDQTDCRSEFTNKIDENVPVGEEFDYIDRYSSLTLLKKKQEEVKEATISMPSCTLSESLMQISTTMPVRNLRVEPQVLKNPNSRVNLASPVKESRYSDKQNCSCLII